MKSKEEKYNKQLRKEVRKAFGLKRKYIKGKSHLTILLQQDKERIHQLLDSLQEDFAKQVGIDRDFLFFAKEAGDEIDCQLAYGMSKEEHEKYSNMLKRVREKENE